MSIFHDFPVLIPLCAGFVTEVGELIALYCKKSQIKGRDILQSGGFPSGHSVFVSSAATAIFLLEGARSPLFAIAVTLAATVMYDAMKIRRAAGHHAEELNRIIGEKKYIETLGHTPLEVFSGLIFGCAFAFFLLSFS